MKKKYKIIALFISMILILSQLTACSEDDLGYLSLLKEIYGLNKGNIEYSINFSPNKQNIYDQIKQNYTQQELQSIDKIISFNNLNLSFTGDFDVSDISNIKFDIDIKYSLDNKEQEDFGSIKFVDNKILISKQAFINICKFTYLEESKFINSSFSDKNYFILADLEEQYLLEDYKEEIDMIFEEDFFLSTLFENFNSGLITKASSGYKFEFDGTKVSTTLKNATKYLIETEKDSYITEYYTYLFSYMDSILQPFINSQFKGSFYKIGNTYTEEMSLNLKYRGSDIGDIYCKSKIELKDVNIKSENISDTIEIKDAINILSSLIYFDENKINIENTEVPIIRTSDGFSSYEQELLPYSTYNYKDWIKGTEKYNNTLSKNFVMDENNLDYSIEEYYSYKDIIEINGQSVLEQHNLYYLISDDKIVNLMIAEFPSIKDAQNSFAGDLYSREEIYNKLSDIGDVAYGNLDFIGFTRANMYVFILNQNNDESIDIKDLAKKLDMQISKTIK